MIDFVPRAKVVESKSLKLYLNSFRNEAAFHEDCTVGIGNRLVKTMAPRWLRIGGYWYPRGGMPIDVFWQTGAPPKGLWLPDTGVALLSWPGIMTRRPPTPDAAATARQPARAARRHPRQGAGARLRCRGLRAGQAAAPTRDGNGSNGWLPSSTRVFTATWDG